MGGESETIISGLPSADLAACPECGGSGQKEIVAVPIKYDSTTKMWKFERRPGCVMCWSTGIVPAERVRWITVGQRLKAERISRGQTVGDRAKQIDAHPTVLIDMERGQCDPSKGEAI